jgi:hypothetical protein
MRVSAVPSTAANTRCDRPMADNNGIAKIGTRIPRKHSSAPPIHDAAGKRFQLPRAVIQRVFSLPKVGPGAALSVITMSRTNRSLIVLCKGIRQLARLSR